MEKSQENLIHGDSKGLRSSAALLIKLADTNQNDNADLPIGAREHLHLGPGHGLSKSSERVILGRLDAKGTGISKTSQPFVTKY
ncbi:Imm32 family immunity protein [Puia sp.]|uniref:Imm32 family immunity protein n=1 Tax=Puia sp. TaxID=2045100 RepID=UPI003BEEEA2A